jgi:hypothetical protein
MDGGWRHELEHGGRKALGKVEVTESHRTGGAMWMRQRWSFTSALVGGSSDLEIGGGSNVLLQLQGVEGHGKRWETFEWLRSPKRVATAAFDPNSVTSCAFRRPMKDKWSRGRVKDLV